MKRLTDFDPAEKRWKVRGTDGQFISWENVQKELVGALYKLKDYEETGLSPEQVENLKAEKEWIPVSESVPADPCENVLVYVKQGRCGNRHFDGAYEIGYYEDGYGWGLEHYRDAEELRITHWMPFPEPPKGVN